MTSVMFDESKPQDDAFEKVNNSIETNEQNYTEAMRDLETRNNELIAKLKTAIYSKDDANVEAILAEMVNLGIYNNSLVDNLRETYLAEKDNETSNVDFDNMLNDINVNETFENISKAQEKEDEVFSSDIDENINISENPEVLEKNTNDLYSFFSGDEFNKKVLADEEVIEAVDNTPLIDFDESGKNLIELQKEERDRHLEMLVEKAKLDVFRENVGSEVFYNLADEEKEQHLLDATKESFLGTMVELRTASQLMADAKNAKDAVNNATKENSSDEEVKNAEAFFSNQLDALATMQYQDRAISTVNTKIPVHVDLVVNACANSYNKAEKFANRLYNTFENEKGEFKNKILGAWQKFNAFKTSFGEKAKSVWGQRFEFAKTLKDSKPKIITDTIATLGLVGATVANAPWLGTAVLAYGAYKTASSWAWPVITEARKKAREDKEKGIKTKSFIHRLKEARKTIWNDKEKRNSYVKQATWGSVAGLVGLGAAGVAGAAAGAVTGKAAQSLATLSVNSARNVCNAVSTVKNKNKGFWNKAATVLGTAVGIGAVAYVGNKVFGNEDSLGDIKSKISDWFSSDSKDTIDMPETHKQNLMEGTKPLAFTDSTAVKTDSIENFVEDKELMTAMNTEESTSVDVEETFEPDNTSARRYGYNTNADLCSKETYLAESGITEKQWTLLQTIWDSKDPAHSSELYQDFYGKISKEMLSEGGVFEGMTREEALFRYQRLASWNLPTHQETVEKLNAFFQCGDKVKFTESDIEALYSVTKNGGIANVVGDQNVVVTNLGIECEDNTALNEAKEVKTTEELFTNEGNGGTIDVTSKEKVTITKYQANNTVAVENEGEVSSVSTSAQKEKVLTDASFGGTNGNIEIASEGVETDFGASGGDELFTQVDSKKQTVVDLSSGGSIEIASEGVETDFGAVNGASVKYEESIIEGVEGVEEGTKAAGNIEERGGFENTGLSEEQIDATKKYFKNMHGKNAYEAFASRITDDMREKGGIFEGLSVEQSMYAVMQMDKWSDEQVGEFAPQIKTMMSYLKDCNDTISDAQMDKIKQVIDRVNDDGTMEGVVGDRAVNVVTHQVQDCGEAGVRKIETAVAGHTEGSGSGMIRLFIERKAISQEPLFEDAGNGEILDLTKQEEVLVAEVKGNNYQPVDLVDDKVDPTSIETNAENNKVLVGSKGKLGGTLEIPTEGQEEDFLADADKSKTYNGKKLSTNPDLAKWQILLGRDK